MVANVLTKALPKAKHIWCTCNLGVRKRGLQWGLNEASSPQASSPQRLSIKNITPMIRRILIKPKEKE
jgi:hypothetical protein